MFDLNLTKAVMKQMEEQQELNRQLSRLMTDVAAGRGYLIMAGATSVSVVARQDGERRIVKVYASPLLKAKRYTKDEALKRLQALRDPTLYRVVKLREAIAVQGDALNVYLGDARKMVSDACQEMGVENTQ